MSQPHALVSKVFFSFEAALPSSNLQDHLTYLIHHEKRFRHQYRSLHRFKGSFRLAVNFCNQLLSLSVAVKWNHFKLFAATFCASRCSLQLVLTIKLSSLMSSLRTQKNRWSGQWCHQTGEILLQWRHRHRHIEQSNIRGLTRFDNRIMIKDEREKI